jgi:hypothetical protein
MVFMAHGLNGLDTDFMIYPCLIRSIRVPFDILGKLLEVF